MHSSMRSSTHAPLIPSAPKVRHSQLIKRRLHPVSAQQYVGAVTAEPGMKFGVVVARFNSLVTKELLEGAQEVFERHGVKSENIDVRHLAFSVLLDKHCYQVCLGQHVGCLGAWQL
jgi:hypothetical protein